jgi:hypothetical protein
VSISRRLWALASYKVCVTALIEMETSGSPFPRNIHHLRKNSKNKDVFQAEIYLSYRRLQPAGSLGPPLLHNSSPT